MLKPNLTSDDLERLATAALALSNALDESDPEMTSLAQYRDPLAYELVNCLDSCELQNRPKDKVVVRVMRGMAEVVRRPEYLEVQIIDHDNGDGLCPICGEWVELVNETADGRLIGSCGDAFTQKQWEAE